jgi:DNA-binding MarR family transcriptional regulator
MDDTLQIVLPLQKWMDVFMRRSMRNFILYSKENNISMPQIGALFHIHHKGTCGVSDIGEELGVTNAAASQMLERLVQQGFIERSEYNLDRRAKMISLTEKGRQTLHESIRARQSWLNDLARALTPAEHVKVVEALNILIERSIDLDGDPLPDHAILTK